MNKESTEIYNTILVTEDNELIFQTLEYEGDNVIAEVDFGIPSIDQLNSMIGVMNSLKELIEDLSPNRTLN